MHRNLILFATVISCAFCLDLPPDFQICKRDDKINECLKAAIQDALPKLKSSLPKFNTLSLDPLEIPAITINSGGSAVNLEQKYKYLKVHNFSMIIVDKVETKFTDASWDLVVDASLSEMKVEGEYDFNGRILLLPIVGTGYTFVVFTDVKLHLEIYGEVFKKKSLDYVDIKKSSMTILPGTAVYRFDNLFNGDKRLSDEMHKVLNDNAKEIWNDIRDGYETAVALLLQNIANCFTKKIPRDQMFLL